jgi:hypothetical protein
MQLTADEFRKVLDGPALPSPNNSAFHFDDHWARNNTLYYVIALCMGIQGLMFIVRVYTQLKVNRGFDVADCM